MNDLKLSSSLSKRLVACVLLSNPLLYSLNAQEAPEAVAGNAISENNMSKVELARVEEAIKQQRELDGDSRKLTADKASAEGNYVVAIEDYLYAIDRYKKSSYSEPRVIEKLKACQMSLSVAYQKQATILAKEAEVNESVEMFEKAEVLLDEALKFDPNLDQFVVEKKKEILAKKQEADRVAKVDAKGLRKAKEALDKEKLWRKEQAQILIANRRFTDAKEILEEVLVLDPYDSQAATMIRRVNEKLFLSGRSRRIATVQERVDEVEWKWSLPLKNSLVSGPADIAADAKTPLTSEYDKINEKLKIIIPRFKHNANIQQVIEELKAESIKQDPEKKGIAVIYRPFVENAAAPSTPAADAQPVVDDPFNQPAGDAAAPATDVASTGTGLSKRYNFDFENMPIGEIIRYICISSNMKYKVDPYAVIVADPRVQIDEMVTRFYPVNSQVFASISETGDAVAAPTLVGGINSVAGGADEKTVESYLRSMGVQFNAGATVVYMKGVSRLVVTNTVTEQRRIQEILNQFIGNAAQVIIESKFVEINQDNLEEFGFQWSLQETASHNERLNFMPNLEANVNVVNGNIGNTNIGAGDTEAIPGVLSGLGSGIRDLTSLGGLTQVGDVLSFTSVLGENQFNTAIRALSMQDNSDVLSAPKVITQNGNTAIIRVVEERYFPESWDPPTVQAITSGGDGGEAVLSIQPTLPIFGDSRDIGVVLEVTPQIDPDGVSIEIELKPQVVEFLRFDDTFNSPIIVFGDPNIEALARYDMPILSSRSIDTRVKIWDGETVVLGGLLQEHVITVNDKIPFLADIPLIGFLFKNEGESHVKRNLLIFVSARLVNNAGLPIRENNIRGLPDFKRL